MADQTVPTPDLVGLTASVVAAYVSGNRVIGNELPGLIGSVHEALAMLAAGPSSEPASEPTRPAVPIRKSVTPEFIICLEDGKSFRSLRRHLGTDHGLTPDQYRQKWGLPPDYPMVAPAYAKARSELAKSLGLGQMRRNRPGKRSADAEENVPKPRGRGRRRSAGET